MTLRICPATGRTCEITGCNGGCVPALPHYAPPNTGWICPRCNVVHAPWVTVCHCQHLPFGPTCSVGGAMDSRSDGA